MKKKIGFLTGWIMLLSVCFVQAAEVWEPGTGTGPETSVWRRLVVYGDQWGRQKVAGHGGAVNQYRRAANVYVGDPALQDNPSVPFDVYDADEDGNTNDGYVVYLEFSETNRVGMADWPTSGIYPGAINKKYYGGVAWNISDSSYGDSIYSVEQGINADHRGVFPESAEDHPLSAQQDVGATASRVKTYWTMLWNKEDFLSGAASGTVSCGTNARMVVLYDRYWDGISTVRFVIKDSGQYYIHDKTFTFADTDPSKTHRFELNPTSVLWAAYNPDGYDIRFETNQTFSVDASGFTDIEAAGIYLAKDDADTGMMHTKWYNFEFDGIVTETFRPSEHIEMVEVPAGGGVQSFYMSNCEVPYTLWHDIYRYANAPTWPTEARALFNKDGDMGSMQFGTNSHTKSEPAVNFTVYDMAVWCNALSEKEGVEPVFYADAAYAEVFRYTNIATRAERGESSEWNFTNPTYVVTGDASLYVKWGADGYRPPTPAEWQRAYDAGNQTSGTGDGWMDANALGQTHPVGTKSTNDLGLYDMVGNVWEFTWIHGDVYVPGSDSSQLAVGGGLHYPNDPRLAIHSASPYGDTPFNGRYDIGLRLVRRAPGRATPSTGTVPAGDDAYEASGIHQWKFSDTYKTTAGTPPATSNILSLVSIPAATSNNPFSRMDDTMEWYDIWIHAFEMSQYEISYETWLKVYFWGIENGYVFDTDGCMGSMRWWDFAHTPDEPVTAIPWHDMVVWCNALSAMEGLDPVYYTDEARTQEYKTAMKFRGIKKDLADQVSEGMGDYFADMIREPWIFANWASDGYRLPTHPEWEYAARGGLDQQSYQWPGAESEYTNYIWEINNAGGTTHPVGQLNANGYGLYDIQGNVGEAMWGVYGGNDPDRPRIEDINNPKDTRYGTWQNSTADYATKVPHSVGGSFFWATTRYIAGDNSLLARMAMNHHASDVGFRVVKCQADTHPVNGEEELIPFIFLTCDTNDFDNLQGRCSQGNLSRNGQYPHEGVATNAAVKWTAPVGGASKSSPVVVDGVVYVGGADGFYALNSTTGTQLWKIAIAEGVDSSACVVDGVVYFGGLDKKMHAVYTNGVEKWATWTYQKSKTWRRKPVYGPVAVAYGMVFASVGNAIRGFSIADGTNSYSPPFDYHYDGAALTMNQDYFFWGPLSAKGVERGSIGDGRVVSGDNGPGSYCRNSALLDGDRVYQFFGGGPFTGGDSDYAALKVAIITNNMAYAYTVYTEAYLDTGERLGCFSSPAVWSNQLLIGLDTGRIESYAMADGTVNSNFFIAGGAVRSPITVSTPDNMVYFGSQDDNVYGLDAETGAKKWEILTGGNVDSAVCVYNGELFVRSDDGLLYCIEEVGDPTVQLSLSTSSVSVSEGSTNTFGVRLTLEPSAETTVTVSRISDGTNLFVQSGASLLFTPETWDVWKTVTLAAAEDDNWTENSAVFRCFSPGMTSRNLTAFEVENDTDPVYTLPWSEPFEALSQGGLADQHGWVADAGAVVTNSDAQGGSQSLSLTAATALHTFLGARTNVWIEFWSRPFRGVPPDEFPAGLSAVFYVNTNDQLTAYDFTNATVITSPTVSNGWNKFEIQCDYFSKVWNLELNDTLVVSNFAFYGSPASFGAFEISALDTEAAFVDSIFLSESPDDTDSDGLPDDWETLYYGNLSPDPLDSASNGVNTLIEAYIAGLDPTDPDDFFLISDFRPLTSVLQWNATSGRVYTIYWTSNLLSGFGTPWKTNLTGAAYTDSTHTAEQKGFYKIEVEME